jgi:hypothetical protein
MLLALMFMRFEAIPSVRKLCLRLERRQYAREICEFMDKAPDNTTFSKFIKTERRSYQLGWRAHTAASMSALPLTFIVRAANVNDKDVVEPLLKTASRLLKRFGKRISHAIADRQYYSAEVFRAVRGLKAEPIIPHPLKVKEPPINLWVTRRFRVRGDPKLVEIYKLRMAMERAFKAGKLELAMDNLRWRGAAKVRMHVAICYACIYAVAITAHRIGRPDLANSIKTFAY